MEWPLKIQGRLIHCSDVNEINALLSSCPDLTRTRFSKMLCEKWNWLRPDGQLKDMACREFLRKLEALEMIRLPESRMKHQPRAKIAHIDIDSSPLRMSLRELGRPAVVDARCSRVSERLFNFLLKEHHYLSFNRTVGRNMKYLIQSQNGRPLGCLLMGSAAWKAKDRDNYIGWDQVMRERNVNLITNNTRFLILPWVEVPHLASCVLAQMLKRVRTDWRQRYNEDLVLVETFVDRSRYKGTCYKAANWRHVGGTVGRSRQDSSHKLSVSQKDIYLYPLAKDYLQRLCCN